jgi:NADPH:quinone reductase-like Zn-dependent oxidoreductase
MKAVVYDHYGSPDVLHLKEIDKPIPKDHEVRVKVRASSINSWDWDLLTGRPLLFRFLLFGVLKPKLKTLGADVAGVVESVGRNVKSFKAGDEVFGDLCQGNWGGFAEYACADEKALVIKSKDMSFAQAAALPQAGVLALQGLRLKGEIKKGQRILINGAGGGVGTFAIQIAKSFGAEVTAVDRTDKLEMLLSIGADYVIDYTKEDFTKNGKQYDLILDVIAHHSIFDSSRSLTSDGTYVMVGGLVSRILQLTLLGRLLSKGGKKLMMLMHQPNQKDLNLMNEFFESGKFVPVIDKCYSLSEVPEAMQHFGRGDVKGKVVITIE